MSQTIFVLLDAMTFEAANETAGYLEQLVAANKAAKYRIRGELPSMSRPMYETCLTGMSVDVHGITDNAVVRRSNQVSVFDLCQAAGLVTAAAAYHWISELYVRAPYRQWEDRIKLDGQGLIDYGIFYSDDTYPDSHLYEDGEYLRRTYHPDFMMYHSMAVDENGHIYGGGTDNYFKAAANVFNILGYLVPLWMTEGYHIVISADHGMNRFGIHGGNTVEQREVPLYIISPFTKNGDFTDHTISQLNVAPLLCKLLGVNPSPVMKTQLEINMNEM